MSYLAVEVTTSLSKVLKPNSALWPPATSQPIPVAHLESRELVPNALEPDDDGTPEIDAAKMLQDAQTVSDTIIREADETAKRLIEEAEERSRSLLVDAQTRGYEEGIRRGREDATATLAVWKSAEQDKLTEMATSMTSQWDAQLQDLEPIVRSFAVAAVEKLLYRELASAPADVEALVQDLLTYVIQSTSVQIRVHPEDYLLARDAHARWKVMKAGDWEISIVPDRMLARGDCEIHGNTGRVDGRLQTRLEELDHALAGFMLGKGESVRGNDL